MQMTTQMYYLRGIYPMISGFLSYSNPYCILLLNRDLTGQVIKSVSCEGYKVSEAQVSGIRSNSTKQQNLISVQNGATAGTESTRRVAFA
ncbi:hypothetical protein CRE_21090 [Caenorhabditis remanei]|nr:hypothetical protein CRE_21090 [Caenorhabditis remanei]